MSENDAMTPEEARDLTERLETLANDLSPRQRTFLSGVLRAGAQSSEVQGYVTGGGAVNQWTGAPCEVTQHLCTGNMFCGTSDPQCHNSWGCPSIECMTEACVAR